MITKRVISLILLALCALTAPAQERLTFQPAEWDFGTIRESDGRVSHTFTGVNRSDTPLVILDVVTTCGCTVPDFSKKPILPGEKTQVTVTYDPTGSGTGVEAAKNGTADIGLASRALKDAEKDGGLTETVIAKDGIAIVVNPANGVEDLTVEQIARIARGEIANWSEVGGGDAIKMVNNLLLGCNMAALAEALTLGVKCGLSVETMKEVISVSSGRSYAMDAKLEKFIMADQFTGGFAVDLQYKDLGLALEASRDEKVPLPMTAAAVQIYEAARAKGQGREDMSSVVKVWEDLTGAQIRGTGK